MESETLLEEEKPAQNEEKRPWKRNPRPLRKVTLVSCDICHSLRGTLRKYEGKWYCENCYKFIRQKSK